MKWVKRLLIIVLVLIVLVLAGAFLFLDSIVKRGVEKVGPAITKTDVKLGSAHISPFSGSGELKKFVVGNPEGYKSPSAISVGVAGVSIEPGSIMGDKVVIRYVRVETPEINFEGSPLGENNLSKLLHKHRGSCPARVVPEELMPVENWPYDPQAIEKLEKKKTLPSHLLLLTTYWGSRNQPHSPFRKFT